MSSAPRRSHGIAGAAGNGDTSSSKERSSRATRPFRQDGRPLSPRILVNPSDFGDERAPRVAVTAEDALVVVWDNVDGQDGDGAGIFGQRLSMVQTPIFVDGFESGNTSAWSATLP